MIGVLGRTGSGCDHCKDWSYSRKGLVGHGTSPANAYLDWKRAVRSCELWASFHRGRRKNKGSSHYLTDLLTGN